MADDSAGDSTFEITDFTNATAWESFVSSLENLIHQWGLDRTEDISANDLNTKQHSKSEVVVYGNRTFTAAYHVSPGGVGGASERAKSKESVEEWPVAMKDMLTPTHDFSSAAHHLSRWYGVQEFVVLAPTVESEALCSEAQAKLIASSVAIAIENTGCCTPVFVQVQLPWRQMYVGVCEGGGVRTSFDMVHLCQTPPPCAHLAGLLDVFKSKIEVGGTAPPTQVAVQFTYALNFWVGSEWEQLTEGDVQPPSLVPFGTVTDPVEELLLSTIWPHLTEEVVIDNSHHSDLTPLLAPVWTIRAKMAASFKGIAASRLTNFMRLCCHTGAMNDVAADITLSSEENKTTPDLSHALDKLTQSRLESRLQGRRHFLRSTLQAGVGRLQGVAGVGRPVASAASGGLAPDQLDELLISLFPDAAHTSSQSSKRAAPTEAEEPSDLRLKACPTDSLTAHLGMILCELSQTDDALQNVVLVWREVVEELRYRWENGHIIPNLPEGPPNLEACLLHQWLQMLNCCIRSKMGARPCVKQTRSTESHFLVTPTTQGDTPTTQEEGHVFVTPNSSFQASRSSLSALRHGDGEAGTSSDEEDEFFEAPEEFVASEQDAAFPRPPADGKGVRESRPSSDDCSSHAELLPCEGSGVGGEQKSLGTLREGVLHPLEGMLLLATGQPLCVPVTQDPGPLTEDMMAEQEQVLARLGTSEEAARVRARLQAGSLLSDMQAFKAANPGCLLEDFVRWYSPRDWKDAAAPAETGSVLAQNTGSEVVVKETGSRELLLQETGNESIIERMEGTEVTEGIKSETAVKEADGGSALLRQGDSGASPTEPLYDQAPTETGSEAMRTGSEQAGSSLDMQSDKTDSDKVLREESALGEGDGWEWDVIDDCSEGVEEPQTWHAKGHLSERMQLPGNTWVEAWQRAEPVPVSRQKPLFDATQEAEKVLHRLAALSPAGLVLQLLPVVMSSVVGSMRDHFSSGPEGLSSVRSVYEGLCALLNRVHSPSSADLPTLQETVRLVEQGEGLVAAAQSVQQKLAMGLELRGVAVTMQRKEELREAPPSIPPPRKASTSLLDKHMVSVNKSTEGTLGVALHGLMDAHAAAKGMKWSTFTSAADEGPKVLAQDFPMPNSKEYILRNIVKCPSPQATPSPQRMFAVITDSEFRLAAAFSRDPNTH